MDFVQIECIIKRNKRRTMVVAIYQLLKNMWAMKL